jgi:hypothetical protein
LGIASILGGRIVIKKKFGW